VIIRELIEALSRFNPERTVGVKLQKGRGDIAWHTLGGLRLTYRDDVIELVTGDNIPFPEAEVVFFEWGAACGACGRHMHLVADSDPHFDTCDVRAESIFQPLDTYAKVLDAYRGKLEPVVNWKTAKHEIDPEHGDTLLKRQGFAQKGDRMRVICDCGCSNFVEFDE